MERPDELTAFLDHVAAEGGELIILGDLLEFWQANMSAVIVKNMDLLDRLAEVKAKYVLGNHDADLKYFIGNGLLSHPFFERMTGPFTREIGDKTFKFMQGHEVDPFNSGDTPSWGRMLAIFAGIFERYNGSPMLSEDQSVEATLTRFGNGMLRVWNWLAKRIKKAFRRKERPSPKDELTPAQNPDRAKAMLTEYAADREREGYDVAVVGHTHVPGRIGDWYFNTGSWATSGNNFVRIEPDGQASVFDWKDGQAAPNQALLETHE